MWESSVGLGATIIQKMESAFVIEVVNLLLTPKYLRLSWDQRKIRQIVKFDSKSVNKRSTIIKYETFTNNTWTESNRFKFFNHFSSDVFLLRYKLKCYIFRHTHKIFEKLIEKIIKWCD
jgi:hypothetical protein